MRNGCFACYGKLALISFPQSFGNRMPIKDAVLGKNVQIFQPDLVNLYGCIVGDDR